MPKYRVMRGGAFGEGWQEGEVVEMDTDAAMVRVRIGDLEPVPEEAEKPKRTRKKPGV